MKISESWLIIILSSIFFDPEDKKFLSSGSKDFSNRILINEEEDVFIWGVVTYVIHSTY